MSRLLNPGLGDYVDRATILRLKIRQARDLDVDHSHFQQELDELEERIGGLEQWMAQPANALARINERLWELNDRIRDAEKIFDRVYSSEHRWQLAQIAIDQYRWNLKRAELVAILNGGGPPEKLQ